MSTVTLLRNDIRKLVQACRDTLPARRNAACGRNAITRYDKNENINPDKPRFAGIENYVDLAARYSSKSFFSTLARYLYSPHLSVLQSSFVCRVTALTHVRATARKARTYCEISNLMKPRREQVYARTILKT